LNKLKKKQNNGLFEAITAMTFLISYFVYIKYSSVAYSIIIFSLIMAFNIAFKVYINKVKRNKLLQSGIFDIDRMAGEQFEEYMLAYFKSQGYSGYLTRATGDYGADLVIEKQGLKIVVQAKRWKDTVGISAIQQVIGAIKHYNADKAMVITNSYFTKNAIELSNSNSVELWDRNYIIANMKKLNNSPSNINNAIYDNKDNLCPQCNSELVLRRGKNGSFYGCKSFPKCRYTKTI
jgi:restriction system protein